MLRVESLDTALAAQACEQNRAMQTRQFESFRKSQKRTVALREIVTKGACVASFSRWQRIGNGNTLDWSQFFFHSDRLFANFPLYDRESDDGQSSNGMLPDEPISSLDFPVTGLSGSQIGADIVAQFCNRTVAQTFMATCWHTETLDEAWNIPYCRQKAQKCFMEAFADRLENRSLE
jgi:hypothetical protein